jgi:hypothetical protein
MWKPSAQEEKAIFTIWSPEELVPAWHASRLRRALANVLSRGLRQAHGLSLAGFDLRGRLTNEDVASYLNTAGERLVGVTETTRNAVRVALRDGLLARDTPQQLGMRLRALPEFNEARARTIASTEMVEATNWAAQTAYERDRRVVGVTIHDQERCAPTGGPCAGMNGRRMGVQEAEATPRTMHPNCSQARTPIMQ